MSDYDALGICPVCGDVETLHGQLCRSCAEQKMIDNDPGLYGGGSAMATEFPDKFCENCGAPFVPNTGQLTLFGGWFCNACID